MNYNYGIYFNRGEKRILIDYTNCYGAALKVLENAIIGGYPMPFIVKL